MATIASCGCFTPRCLHDTLQRAAGSHHSNASSSSCQRLPRPWGVNAGGLTRKNGAWKILVSGGRNEGGRREIKLNEDDMMTLEFGRLLGESRETTLSKILRSKADPDATFLDVEEALLKGKPPRPVNAVKAQETQEIRRPPAIPKRPQGGAGSDGSVPELLSRPPRPRAASEAEGKERGQGQGIQIVRPVGKKVKAEKPKVEDADYGQLIRKPIVVGPKVAPVEVITPMTLRRAKETSAVAHPLTASSMLRKPVPKPTTGESGNEVSSSDGKDPAKAAIVAESLEASGVLRKPSVAKLAPAPTLRQDVVPIKDGLADSSASTIQAKAATVSEFPEASGVLPKPSVANLASGSPVGQDVVSDKDDLAESGASTILAEVPTVAGSREVSDASRVPFVAELASGPTVRQDVVSDKDSLPKSSAYTIQTKAATAAESVEAADILRKPTPLQRASESDIRQVVSYEGGLAESSVFTVQTSGLLENPSSAPIAAERTDKKVFASAEESLGAVLSLPDDPSQELSSWLDSGPSLQSRPKSFVPTLEPQIRAANVLEESSSGSVLSGELDGFGKEPVTDRLFSGSIGETAPELDQREESSVEPVGTDRFGNWSDLVKRAVLKSEARLPADAEQRQEANDLASGKPPVEWKSGMLRRPATASYTTRSSRQQLQDTRPYVPKPPTPLRPVFKEADESRSTLETISNKVMNSPDSKSAVVNETDDDSWAQAEALRESLSAFEVEIVKVVGDGVVASFGNMSGYIPAWELSPSRNISTFRSWAQARGIDVTQKRAPVGVQPLSQENGERTNTTQPRADGGELVFPTDEQRQDLLDVFKEERSILLSAFVGQKATVVITSVDKTRKRMTWSERRTEGEAFVLAQKKAAFIATLKIGDVVDCVVTKVTTIGAFVKLEGVTALIHASELSWNRVVDPSAHISVGQEVQAKVTRLDRHFQRISLSLRQMQPDPLQETLESLVSSQAPGTPEFGLSESLESNSEVPEMNGLEPVLKRLVDTEGISGVRKGRRFRGAALATSFQIYLSEPVDDGFKLLARSGNEVQEILVQTSVSKEEMKRVILGTLVDEEQQ